MDQKGKTQYFRDISEFKFLEAGKLGKGSFGEVRLALHLQTNRIYAIKIIDPKQISTEVGMQALQRETTLHSSIDHPHIIKLWQVLKDQSHIYMVMEYAERGNLFYYQNKKRVFSEEEAAVFFTQTLSAVSYLHSLNLLHRDLKPENLLLDKDFNVKVCDFGWIITGIKDKHSTFCGTYQYMAPEMIFDQKYDHKIDIWALGVLLYELLHGFAPFEGETVEDVRQSMLQGELEIDTELSEEVQNLICSILRVNPEDRLTAQEIQRHPWIQNIKNKRIASLLTYKAEQQSEKYCFAKTSKPKGFEKMTSNVKQDNQMPKQPKPFLLIKQNKKIGNSQSTLNLKTHKSKTKQKENFNRATKQPSLKKITAGHRSQASNFSEALKQQARLRTEMSSGKAAKQEIIRFNTEFGEALEPCELKGVKKRKINQKKSICFFNTSSGKFLHKPKLIRKSID